MAFQLINIGAGPNDGTGDDIVLTVSSNSSCADMSFTIKYTRTLA